MSKRGSFDHMISLSKKKPKIKEALDNLDNLSVSQITNMQKLPMWVRKHLLTAKKMKDEFAQLGAEYDPYISADKRATDIANVMISKTLREEQELKGIVYIYAGNEMRIGRPDTMQGMIYTNDHVFVFPEDLSQIVVAMQLIKPTIEEIHMVLNASECIGIHTKREYNRLNQNRINASHMMMTDPSYDIYGDG